MAARGNTPQTSRKGRLRYWVGGFALLAAVGTGAAAFAGSPDSSGTAAATAAGSSATPTADPSPTASATPSPTTSPVDTSPTTTPTPTPTTTTTPSGPVITYRRERQRTSIPFATRNVKTAALNKGVTRIKQRGRRGVRVSVYRLTFTDGVQSHRQLVNRYVARRPVPRIVLHGTYVKPKPKPTPKPSNRCDPNYSGACVPIASDVDCAGGSGNGPAYVQGPVRVVGTDIYGLDSDGDGWGCES